MTAHVLGVARPTPARGSTRRRVVALLVAVAAVGAWLAASAAPAVGHAVLLSTTPGDRAQLADAPAEVVLRFNEPVEVPTGGLRVFDRDARRVDTGPVDTPSPDVVGVGLPADLPVGGYVVTYRVISADSHPLAGVLSFTVGDAEELDDAFVAELFGGAGAGVAGVVGPVLRGLGYVATLLAAGALAFAALVARRPVELRTARVVGTRAGLAAAVLALLAVPWQGAAVAGVPVLAALTSSTVLAETLNSSFGESTLLRVTGAVALVALWRVRAPALLTGAAAGAMLGSYVLDGHQRTVEPSWLLRAADALHLGAGALWFGGLVLLWLALRRRVTPEAVGSVGAGSVDAAGADEAVAGARLVARFSSVALVSVALVGVAGVAMAVPLVGSVGALTSTTYGWTLLAKTAGVGIVLLVAFYNRQRLVPAIERLAVPAGGSVDTPLPADERRRARGDVAWGRLTRTVQLEAAVLVAVLLLTGFLVSQQPAAEAAGLGGLYETTATLGDGLEVDLVVDPNRAGRNTVHAYVLDATGRPSTQVEDLVFEFTYVPEGIGPIAVEPFFAGPGHWIATIDDLAFAGEWEVRVVAGIDRFTERDAVLTVPVAP